MQLETIRSLADWLQFGTNGPAGAAGGPGSANAMIAAVTRDAGDPAPTPIATFGDETRTSVLARRRIPRESPGFPFPLLGVIGTEDWQITDAEVETVIRDGQPKVAIVYAHQVDLSDQGVRDWHYTNRALQQSLKLWLLNTNIAFRTRNGILVLSCLEMRPLAPFLMAGDVQFAGGLSLTLHVRDTTP